MVYSTCTFEPEENEEVIQHLIELGAEVLEIEVPGLKARSGLQEWNGKKFDFSISKSLRVYPHYNNTLGFFVCLLQKPEGSW
jgi:16S rRNA C967 or C1407 C5-methylase (RsmB/RsmF family)